MQSHTTPAIACTAVMVVLVPLVSAHADTIHVPADQPTIQAGIDAAKAGDEVIIAPGTYDENINLLGKAITLRSTDPADPVVVSQTVIRGSNGDTVNCSNSETPSTVLEGLLITQIPGTTTQGLRIAFSSPTVRDCIFHQLHARGTLITGASASPSFTRCVFLGCSRDNFGGAALVQQSTVTFEGCAFRQNFALFRGGAAEVAVNAVATFTNCQFEDNSTGEAGLGTGIGGAVSVFAGSATFAGCSFRFNQTEHAFGGSNGSGALSLAAGTTVSIGSTVFCENAEAQVVGEYTDLGGNLIAFACPMPGACCLGDSCIVASEVDCAAAGGEFQGEATSCAAAMCPSPTCPWDFSGDGDVGGADLGELLLHWGECGRP